MGKKVEAVDHLGNKFDSITDMCNHYGVSTRLYYDRLSRKYTQQQALGIEEKQRKKLYTKEELIKIYNLTDEQSEIAIILSLNGHQIKLLASNKLSIDHTGTPHDSFSNMCKAWGKNTSTVRSRLKRGISLSEALEK